MIRIIENALLAKIAARVLKSKTMAITFGSRIYLHNASKDHILNNRQWLRHELKHVEQYKKMGFIRFIVLYAWYSVKYGYYRNPLEVEARLAEDDRDIINRHQLPS